MLQPSRFTLCLLVITAVLPVAGVADDAKTPPMLTPEEQKLAVEAAKLDREFNQLYQRGQAAEASVKARAALEIRRKLYPISKYPDGHTDLASNISDLGVMLQTMGSSEKAVPYYEEALAMNRKLYPASKFPDGHPDLATSINNMGFLRQAMGAYERALPHWEQALAMKQKLYPASKYPDGHPQLATGINNLGFLLKAMGKYEQALPHYRQALAMTQKLYPTSKYADGHPDLARGMNNLGFLLQVMGSFEEAVPYWEQALAMNRKLYPASKYADGHLNLALSINNLGFLLQTLGSHDKALPHYEQALAMYRKLYPASKYPNGHPDLAQSINNVAVLLETMSSSEKALPYFEQALTMKQKLYTTSNYPNGHPDLAQGFSNLGFTLQSLGSLEKALSQFEQASALRHQLYPAAQYPAGHPDLSLSLNNLGSLFQALGSYDRALPYFEQALAMDRKLYPESKYPDGHPDLASRLNNLSGLLHAMGSYEQALLPSKQALTMYRQLGRRVLTTASEAEALAFANAQPQTCDTYLSLTTQLPDTAKAAYDAVWASKSAVTRVLQQRHAAARVAGTEYAALFDELKGLRRRVDQLLQDRRLAPAQRDKLLTEATNSRDALERTMAAKVPVLQRAQELDALGPDALLPLLPSHAVLIDLVRYTRVDCDPARPGRAGEMRTLSYAAFVLAKDQPVRRIELGEAKRIDDAIQTWRGAIDRGADVRGLKIENVPPERSGAFQSRESLQRRVWEPLRPHIPAGTTTLYLSPDGDLARMPWAALPTGQDRVLLEDYVLATVPHGPFLLGALKYPRDERGVGTTLLLGGIDYHPKPWPNLPGTATEMTALTSLAPSSSTTLTKADATPGRLTEMLPTVRYAHFATHGYFDAQALRTEQKRAEEAMKTREFGDDTRRVAARNPLAFVGLVLSEGEVFSGLSLLDLPLEDLRLVTLSACETGLGEYTGGEGVQGLQRAFHLAGCPNVVASLWKVNDAATAALMAKFYHELWVNKKPPIEALREAQLTIYRRPDLIATLASAERGVKLERALNAKGPPLAESKDKTPTKLWAAFVLSGVGR